MNHEVFKLDCCCCGHNVELPAGSAERELVECPRCGEMLEVRWRVAQKPEPA
jgi:uncharacterized paraquat-inducible protein A